MGEGDREAVEGASHTHRRFRPSTMLRMVPLPRCAGEDRSLLTKVARHDIVRGAVAVVGAAAERIAAVCAAIGVAAFA